MYRALLEQVAAEGEPIRVGIIGAGKFGAGVVAQLAQMQGIEASLIADLDLDRARYAYTASYVPEDEICEVSSRADAEQAIFEGRPAVTQDGLMLTQCDLVDVVVEATGVPPVGGVGDVPAVGVTGVISTGRGGPAQDTNPAPSAASTPWRTNSLLVNLVLMALTSYGPKSASMKGCVHCTTLRWH